MKPIEFINQRKLNDITKISLSIITGFDGYTKTSMSLDSFRLACLNGMVVKDTSINVSFKNTKGNIGRASSLCYDASRVIANMDNVAEQFKQLNSLDILETDVNKFMFKLLGYSQKEYNELNANKRNILDKINASVGLEFSRSGATAWGLLNGITHYTNHIANAKNREDYIYFDTGAKMNTKAQGLVLAML